MLCIQIVSIRRNMVCTKCSYKFLSVSEKHSYYNELLENDEDSMFKVENQILP